MANTAGHWATTTDGRKFDCDCAVEADHALGDTPEPEPEDYWTEAYAAQWDDDPNPYHGDYSEM